MEIKREVNEKGTVYNIQINNIRIHEEYCLSSAQRIVAGLTNGKQLVDLVSNSELINLKDDLTKIKSEIANFKDKNIKLSSENGKLKQLLKKIETGELSFFQYRVQKITGLPAPESLNNLDLDTFNEILSYITIFVQQHFLEHWQVNQFISKNKIWDKYPNIRSINTHRSKCDVEGIYPEYYSLICDILDITGDSGSPLVNSRKY